MRNGVISVATVTVLAASLPALRAQHDIEPGSQAAASADITKPYEPPSASRSVETGNFYLRKKKYNAALSRFQEANTTDPGFAPAYLGLGRVYEKIGLKQKALDAYHKYLDALPSSKQADEAKAVHKSIDRLERELHKTSQNHARQRGAGNRVSLISQGRLVTRLPQLGKESSPAPVSSSAGCSVVSR